MAQPKQCATVPSSRKPTVYVFVESRIDEARDDVQDPADVATLVGSPAQWDAPGRFCEAAVCHD